MSEGTGSCRRGGDGRTPLRPATRAHTHLVNRQLLQLAAHSAWWPLRGWVAGVHLWAAGSKQASSSRHAGRGGRACTWQRWRRRPCACAACPAAPCSRHAPRPLHRHRHPGDGVEVALVQRHGVVGVDHLDLCGRGRCAAGQARRCGRRCGRAASFECPSSHAAAIAAAGPCSCATRQAPWAAHVADPAVGGVNDLDGVVACGRKARHAACMLRAGQQGRATDKHAQAGAIARCTRAQAGAKRTVGLVVGGVDVCSGGGSTRAKGVGSGAGRRRAGTAGQ